MEKVEIAEVLNQIVKRACNFEKQKTKMTPPTATTTTTTTTTATITTTTAYRKTMAEVTAIDEAAIEKDVGRGQVLVQPVVEAGYPNLVSIFSKK